MTKIKRYFSNSFRLLLTIAIGISVILSILSPSVLAAEISPHWRYGGAENPTQWGSLSKNFLLCELGRNQSPINIKNAIASTPANINFDYKPSPLVVVNNGHTIQVNYIEGSAVAIDNQTYTLLQFHFHTPSEHSINAKASAMELHLVHRNAAGQLAVVGIMLNKGKANPLIAEIWKNIPAMGATNTVSDRLINATALLPKRKSYYTYDGSLTTPPCSEDVKWNILTEPMTISDEQITTFEKLYQVNTRPLQPISDRKVLLHF